MFLHTCDPMGGPQPLFGVRRASPNTTGRPTATEARCVVPSLICGPVHLQLSASNGNVLVQEARWWSLDTLAETEYQMWIRSVQLIRMSKGFQTWEPRIVWHIHEVIILYHISVWHAQEYNGPSWNNIVYNNTHTHTYIYNLHLQNNVFCHWSSAPGCLHSDRSCALRQHRQLRRTTGWRPGSSAQHRSRLIWSEFQSAFRWFLMPKKHDMPSPNTI